MQKLYDLDARRRYFCIEYIKDLIMSRAARRANISTSLASEWLKEPDVQTAIQELMSEREERAKVDAEWVLVQLAQMFNADIADLYDFDTGDLLPVHEWPEIWRKMTTSIDVDTTYSGRGEDREETGRVKKLRVLDRLKVLEMLGKHVNVKAFADKLEISTDKDLTQRLIEGRRRAKEVKQNMDFM
jgi:phage terminase small subunit